MRVKREIAAVGLSCIRASLSFVHDVLIRPFLLLALGHSLSRHAHCSAQHVAVLLLRYHMQPYVSRTQIAYSLRDRLCAGVSLLQTQSPGVSRVFGHVWFDRAGQQRRARVGKHRAQFSAAQPIAHRLLTPSQVQVHGRNIHHCISQGPSSASGEQLLLTS